MDATLKLLKDTRHLLSDPENWCQGSFYRSKASLYTGDFSQGARCILGAISWTGRGLHISVLNDCVQALYPIVGDPVLFNDTEGRTHAEILQAFDHAIEWRNQQQVSNQVAEIFGAALLTSVEPEADKSSPVCSGEASPAAEKAYETSGAA
jgi:hypothetical protein